MDQSQRIQLIKAPGASPVGPVLYWMQAAVRTRFNHALEYALHLANHRRVPLNVFFVLTPDYPGATERHYRFLLEGLRDAASNLAERGIPFTLHQGDPGETALRFSASASTLVTEKGYTRPQRHWREKLTAAAVCPVVLVDTNVVVPVEEASPKEEYTAATIRPKIHRLLDTFLQPVPLVEYWQPVPPRERVQHWPEPPGSPAPAGAFTGGETQAGELLQEFLTERLRDYGEARNVPDKDWTSRMSPYLHFGHISPVEIALRAIDAAEAAAEDEAEATEDGPKSTVRAGSAARTDSAGAADRTALRRSVETLVEELVVRRELAINFTWYNENYDSYRCLPEWSRRTLNEHSTDERPYIYNARQLEQGETHDPYWNACQQQMVRSGMMHGYMRMYWGKKILEWTQNPEDAYAITLEMNDRWELDGRDPNGYAGVAWCYGKHDRPWVERPIFGKVRYMNDRGLQRKFREIDRYVTRWSD